MDCVRRSFSVDGEVAPSTHKATKGKREYLVTTAIFTKATMDAKQYVYVLKSLKDGSLYIGCTDNIDKRFTEHNAGLSTYTSSRIPWELKWFAVFPEKSVAYNFESYLKTASGKAFLNKRLT